MKKVLFILLALLCANISRADNPPKVLLDGEEVDIDNLPIIDGYYSTFSLRRLIIAKLLGVDYFWNLQPPLGSGEGYLELAMTTYYDYTSEERSFISSRLPLNKTHDSFLNLIENKSDLIINQRRISDEEKEYADEQGVTLLEKPIAVDALAFIVNQSNPVNNLSINQIQGIYTGDIINWNEVGGEDATITAALQPSYIDTRELFNSMVMDGHTPSSLLETTTNSGMRPLGSSMIPEYYFIKENQTGLTYTSFYYCDFLFSPIAPRPSKVIGVNNVAATRENIINGTYPYVTNVYASIRSDIDKSSVAYKIYEFLTTDEGQSIVDESGYIPLPKAASISNMSKVNANITIRDHTINIVSEKPAQRIEVADMQGRTIFLNTTNANYISVPTDMHGVYMVSAWFANGEKLTKKIYMK